MALAGYTPMERRCPCGMCVIDSDREIYGLRREVDRMRYEMRDLVRYEARNAVSVLARVSTDSPLGLSDGRSKPMNTLTVLAKRMLDSDTRAFIKAGILDDSLNITKEGRDFLLAQYLTDNKVRLAKEARRKIREDKEKKEDSDEA